MDTNRIAVPGALSIATKVRMAWQGLIINLYLSIATAVLFCGAALWFHPPQPVPFDLIPSVQIGVKFSIQDYLYRNGFALIVPAPDLQSDISMLSPELTAVLYSELSKAEAKYWHQYYLYLYALIAGFFAGLGTMIFLSNRETKRRSEDQYVRGAKLVTSKELDKKTRAKDGRFVVGGVHLPKHAEILPKIYVGRPQQGKSTGIKSEIDQHRKADVGRHVIFCSKGDFMSTHFRKGIDLMFAPGVDIRTIRFGLFANLTAPEDIPAYAEALIPAATGNGTVFSNGARALLEGILIHCLQNGKISNSEIYDVCCLPLVDLSELLKKTPGAEQAASLIANPTEQPAPSYHSNFMVYTKPLAILAKLDGDFSIKNWLENGTGDLFIVAKPKILPAIAPLLSLFIHVTLETHKNMDDDRGKRIWYILDEVTVLPKIPGLESAANFGPSKGLCLTLGIQSYYQLDNVYTQPVRRALVSSAGTHIFFSVGDPAMAKEASAIIGSADLIVNRQTISTGVQDSRDGGNSSDQDATKAVVSPDQILDLQPLHAYLRFLGYPGAAIEIPYVPYPAINEIEADPQFSLGAWLQASKDKANGVVVTPTPEPTAAPGSEQAADPDPIPVPAPIPKPIIQAAKESFY